MRQQVFINLSDQIEENVKANQSVVVIIDEAYTSFGGGDRLTSRKSMTMCLSLLTFSKDATCWFACRYGIGSPKLMAVINAVKDSVNS